MDRREIEALVDRVTESVLARVQGAGPDAGGVCGCPAGSPPEIDRMLSAGAERLGAERGLRLGGECAGLAGLIDHTLLAPDAIRDDIEALCRDAIAHRFASVCVNSCWVQLAATLLADAPDVKVCTVVGFPFGASSTYAKAAETRAAVADGAREIDMVLNVGALKSGDLAYVQRDIRAVVECAEPAAIVKVILETALLADDEKVSACRAAVAAGAHFVKTSTGFSKGGATVDDIALMRRIVGARLGVKASGGVRDCGKAAELIEAGADRIGASASVAIVQGAARGDGAGGGY